MFKDVDIVCIFLRNRALRLRQKTALAQCTIAALPMHHWRQFPLSPTGKTVPPGESW